MTTTLKKVELLADIAIVIVAILLIAVLVKSHLLPSNSSQSNSQLATTFSQQSQVGRKINLPDVDWHQNGRTLLLVLSTTCHFCSESAQFYQQLVKEQGGHTRMIAVLPQSIRESRDYLNKLGVLVSDIKQASPSSVGVTGTPTLILVDGDGVVEELWVGKLTNTEEAKVINQMQQSIVQK